MALIFYPQEDEIESGSLDQKLEILLGSAERYRVIVLDVPGGALPAAGEPRKKQVPRDMRHAWHWDGLASVLREIRELPESTPSGRLAKAMKLEKLAEVYEILRGAKMPRLEAVRLALVNESAQLRRVSV